MEMTKPPMKVMPINSVIIDPCAAYIDCVSAGMKGRTTPEYFKMKIVPRKSMERSINGMSAYAAAAGKMNVITTTTIQMAIAQATLTITFIIEPERATNMFELFYALSLDMIWLWERPIALLANTPKVMTESRRRTYITQQNQSVQLR